MSRSWAARGARLRSELLLFLVLTPAMSLAGRRAEACGSSGPDGVSACSLADYAEEQRPRWRVGVSGIYTSTMLSFGGFTAGETRYATLAEVAYSPTARLTWSAGLGVAIGGRLLAPDGPHDFGPGSVASLAVSYRLIDARTAYGRAFVVGSLLFSYTGTSTQVGREGPTTAYDALDIRGGVAAGYTWQAHATGISGYLVARAFGGPVFWSYEGASQLGTDTHHYQVGAGLAVLLARRVDVFAEGVALGEQALSAGISVAF